MAGASPAILAAHLIVVLPSHAADITISSSITTGTVWSGAANPSSNLTITPSGTINTANPYGVTITGTVGSTLGTLLNSGQIIDTATSGRAVFIQAGSVAAIVNTGSISGTYALWNDGSLGTLTNSGTIVGGINNTGTIGTIVNSGRILGDVSSVNRLTLVGGSSGTMGTFAGAGTIRNTITGTAGIVIAGGSMFINDHINVGTDTLYSQGTNLTLAANTTITGNYRQTLSSNTLTTSALTVTGRVTLAGGTIIPSFSNLSNYIVGTAASVLYSPIGITNLGAAFGTAVAPTGARFSNIGASGTTLVYFNPLMDYVGGNLASISVGSTILNGTSTIYPTAIYIASTGNLGTLSNTGTIRGDIINLSTNDLNIKGGTLNTIGTITGYNNSIGTISNALSNINLISGNIRLVNNVDVGSNTFTNLGGQLSFNTLGTTSITGNFVQTAGVLALHNALTRCQRQCKYHRRHYPRQRYIHRQLCCRRYAGIVPGDVDFRRIGIKL